MILQRLTLRDFRVFRGEHSFDLKPRRRAGRQRLIVLLGGMNGAGKTTILTAVRLALYGKASLGTMVGRAAYHEYLANSVHKSRNAAQANAACVTLSFSYAQQGQISEYEVRRSWSIRGKQVTETLTISKDGVCMDDFSTDQRQAFLNDLVPLGISELFFFDGEKISELAEDTTGEALQDAVRKLLGLDLIEQLRNDLLTFMMRRKKDMLPEELQEGLSRMEARYNEIEQQSKLKMQAAVEIRQQTETLALEIKRLQGKLESKGGTWSKPQNSALQDHDRLMQKKEDLENLIREEMEGIFPLTAVQPKLEIILCELQEQQALDRKRLLSSELSGKLEKLHVGLSDTLPDAYAVQAHEIVTRVFGDMPAGEKPAAGAYGPASDLSEAGLLKIKYWIRERIPQSRKRLTRLSARLNAMETELARRSLDMEQAPDEVTLEEELGRLLEKSREAGKLHARKKQCLKEANLLLKEMMSLNRKMQQLQDQKKSTWYLNQSVTYASDARNMLKKFIRQTAERRARELGDEFENIFARIARKEDLHVKVQVDPATFEVTLFDAAGEVILKKNLSAGEKQIFAVSILDALGKTSGRKLPIIVDTPLSRLDSKHRKKLVQHYFPCASHQVIILSTDTEIDAGFFNDLSPEISHVYEIYYNPELGCSAARPGYFWMQHEQEELQHAS